MRALSSHPLIPAKAGTQAEFGNITEAAWAPAFAGVSGGWGTVRA